jgi:transposase
MPEDIHAECRCLSARQAEQIAALQAEVAKLRRSVEELERRLNQNSRNSSRPPSSDAPSAPPRKGKEPTGRSPGGQPGHPGHGRDLLPPEKVNHTVVVKPLRCRGCGHPLRGEDADPLRHQVSEIPPLGIQVTEYQRHRLQCARCGETTMGELPEGVPEGAFGPRLRAVVAYLTAHGHLSKRQIEEMLRDVFGLSMALGSVVNVQQAVSAAVAPAVQEAKSFAQKEPVKNADETGWKEGPREDGRKGRKKAWAWVIVTQWVTVFLIHASRGAQAANELLGDFHGYLTSDRWKVYRRWFPRQWQVCWAHVKRDFTGMSELSGEAGRIGAALVEESERLFALWRRIRDGTLKRSTFRVYVGPIRQRVQRLLEEGSRCGTTAMEGKCREMLKVFPAFWTFVRVEGIEPTNNAAERALRPLVLYRKGCFGTHSEQGSRFVERMFTVVATLRRQKRNVLEYLTQACARATRGLKPMSLLPGRSHHVAA